MRSFALRVVVALLATAAVVFPIASLYSIRDVIMWSEVSGMLVVSFFIFLAIVSLRLVYARTSIWILLFVGLLIYYIGTLLDALDEVFVVNRLYEVVEGVLLPVGMGLSIIGFFHLLRNQRQAQRVLEEHKTAYERLSITDELTGLYNSRHFYEQLQAEMQRSLRYGRRLSVLLLDIDDFKKHNDSFGHIEGDRVLRRLGKLISSVLRENDSGYRYGGEEFTVILPETSDSQAEVVAERIRADFKAVEFEPDGTMVTKTLSAGVAEYGSQDDIATLIKKADQAMYLAKRRGKDQVAVYEGSEKPTKSGP
jgi:diguanylate cyclase (GGDEF)-like protein